MSDKLYPRDHEELLQAVRDEQIRIEESRREATLSEYLFHDHLVSDTFNENRQSLEAQFLRDKKGKNMGERLEMALKEPYLGVIRVVELGVTTSPSLDGEIDGLKHDWNDLKNWMVLHGWIEDELPRSLSGRSINIRKSQITNERVVIGRTRPLVSAVVPISLDDTTFSAIPVKIDVAKHMLFSVPATFYLAVSKRFDDPRLVKESSISCIEDFLEKRSDSIDSILTAYYLHTELI